MSFSFGDSFDLYTAAADALLGYWDTMPTLFTLVTGRFSGSQALRLTSNGAINLTKSSGVNDAVHHLVVAFQQTSALSGTTACGNLQLLDGTTVQCTVVFRSDGTILLTSGGPTGTTLATYTGAVTATNTWYAFEFEIVINNTTGRFRVRKNGNTTDDYDSGAALNTRSSANNYANKLQIGSNSASNATQNIDDLFWRSDASSVAWMGDLRCYTRMPASDASVQFSRVPTSITQTPFTNNAFNTPNNNVAFYSPITASYDGSVGTATLSVNAGFTGNIKCSVFNDASGVPGTVRSSATTVTNPTTGINIFTFPTPFTVVKGTQYWLAFEADTTASNAFFAGSGSTGKNSTTSYAAFPVASPATVASAPLNGGWVITLSANYQVVSEAQQDAVTSYVYDSTPGHADLYGIASIGSTPSQIIAVTTRGLMQKSDAGTRTAAVQIKSGGTTVASSTLTLTTSGWQWAWRTDLTDPNTSAAWAAAAVDSVNIGPKTVA